VTHARAEATMKPVAPDRTRSALAAAERAARESNGKLVAFLAARERDLAGAEDALADALAAALAVWPPQGVPANPEGWLVIAARRKLVDAARRRQSAQASEATLALIAEELETAERETIPDRRLALMFACAHPAIDEAIRAPLMLQTILGLDAAAIASPAAMGQRLARAKAKIRLAGVPFRMPEREDLPERLAAVFERRSTPLSPTAGTKPSRTTRAGAILPRRPFGSAAWSPHSRRTSPRPKASSP